MYILTLYLSTLIIELLKGMVYFQKNSKMVKIIFFQNFYTELAGYTQISRPCYANGNVELNYQALPVPYIDEDSSSKHP